MSARTGRINANGRDGKKNRGNGGGRNSHAGGPAPSRKRKNNFAIFYVITMIIGVVVCVTLFALAYQTLVPDRIVRGGSDRPEGGLLAVDDNRVELSQTIALITAIESFAPASVTVRHLEGGREERLNVTETTTVQNRIGSPIGLGNLSAGQLVDISFDAQSQDLASIALSSHAREEQRSGVNINLETATITVGNEVFRYSSRTLVLSRGEPFSVSLINPEDLLTLVSYQDKIWSIRVDSGHGFIRFENADQVTGGRVTIGNTTVTGLEDDRPISTIEGIHRIVVEAQNIEPFVADVEVRQGETVTVDLRNVTFRTGTLRLVMNEPEASVFLNGEAVELENSVVEIEFGTHILRVEMAGFIPIQEEIEITQAFTQRELILVRDALIIQVLIETFPSEAQIFVDDAMAGISPVTITVEDGLRTIRARRAGYEDRVLDIVVDADSPRQFLLHMTQLPMHPPNLVPELPDADVLPPMPDGWGPVPPPVIPPAWEAPPQQPGQQQPQQPPVQQQPGAPSQQLPPQFHPQPPPVVIPGDPITPQQPIDVPIPADPLWPDLDDLPWPDDDD